MRLALILTVVWCVMACSAVVDADAAKLEIAISTPADGSSVVERPIVAGTVTRPDAAVWVVVHPLAVSDYWVQPAVSVRKDGTWKLQIYIGRPGNVDLGKHFEIRAVANPNAPLREGLVLPGWPEAEAMSDLAEVVRK